jgi:hypothetical protein
MNPDWRPYNGWGGWSGYPRGWLAPSLTGGAPYPYFAMNWPNFSYPITGGFRPAPYWPANYYPYFPTFGAMPYPGFGLPPSPSYVNGAPPAGSSADESELVFKVADDATVQGLQPGSRNFYAPVAFAAIQPQYVANLLVKSGGELGNPVTTSRIMARVVAVDSTDGARQLTVRVPSTQQVNVFGTTVTGVTILTPVAAVAQK